jgi:hypothetical protein
LLKAANLKFQICGRLSHKLRVPEGTLAAKQRVEKVLGTLEAALEHGEYEPPESYR